MGLKRRTFLQRVGLSLAALGISETGLSLLDDQILGKFARSYQALAQSNARKLALLVGINQYPAAVASPNKLTLSGCATDVELQQELLIHRLGFQRSNILHLTDRQATRKNIEEAFVNHLIKEAAADDVVLFHFSGYGSQVQLSDANVSDAGGVRKESYCNALVPVDGALSAKGSSVANCLLEDTLFLLLRSLKTDRVFAVLDTSYATPESRPQSGLRPRSCSPLAGTVNPDELAFQKQLLRQTDGSLNPAAIIMQQRQVVQPSRLILAAAEPEQLAFEARWNGFDAGLLTYALTQALWQATPTATVQISLRHTLSAIQQRVGQAQQPHLSTRQALKPLALKTYLASISTAGADGVVTALENDGKTAVLWLGGLPATVLMHYGVSSRLRLSDLPRTAAVSGSGSSPMSDSDGEQVQVSASTSEAAQHLQLQIRSREGLTARAQLCCVDSPENYKLEVGQWVQETVRVLPRSVDLTVALDPGLERIERVDATSGFSDIPEISSVATASEQLADCMFGRVLLPQGSTQTNGSPTESIATNAAKSESSYGLFSLSYELLPNTAGEAGEAVKLAIRRLMPQLQTLRAAKLLHLTVNEDSSLLKVRATLETVAPQPRILDRRVTVRAPWPEPASGPFLLEANSSGAIGSNSQIPTISAGSRIQLRIQNDDIHPLYFLVMVWDSNGDAIALYATPPHQPANPNPQPNPEIQQIAIDPARLLVVPGDLTRTEWKIQGQPGIAEVQLFLSRAPFTQTFTLLDASPPPNQEGLRIQKLSNPLEVAQTLLQDLHQASRLIAEAPDPISAAYALNVDAWATLSFIYQVV